MGRERANAMMSLLPPVGWADVATKHDLNVLETATKRDLDAHTASTKQDIDAVRHDIDAVRHDIEGLESRLESRFVRIEGKLDTMATKVELDELRSDLQRTFVTWMFASQAAVVAAIGLLIAFIR